MPTIRLTGNYGYTSYRGSNLAAGTVIDATTASWSLSQTDNLYPFRVYGASEGLLARGGSIWGNVTQTADWQNAYINSAAIRVENTPGVILDDWRIDKAWDAIRIGNGATNFLIDDAYITNVRDDAVENDDLLGGTIRDSLFDGVFSGISMDGSSDGLGNLLSLEGAFIHMKEYLYKGEVTHMSPFKTNSSAPETTPDIRIINSVIAIEDPDHNTKSNLKIAWDHVVESRGNVFLNLSDTPLSSSYPMPPSGFTILQGQQARDYWEKVKAAWHDNHDGTPVAEITPLPPLTDSASPPPAAATPPPAGGSASADKYPRMLGDINGDGFDDQIGFGEVGVFAAQALGNGTFGGMYLASPAFGASQAAGGWSNADKYPRMLGDINGDGLDDLVGFGEGGVFAAQALGNGGFGTMYLAAPAFGASKGWTSADKYPRTLADINGDGFEDLIGFGEAGVFAALALGNGTFGHMYLATPAFGASQGWTSADKYPRTLGDINGDGLADLIGFGEAGVFVAQALGNGAFGNMYLAMPALGASQAAGGWTSTHPRTAADVNGDGLVDLIGFGDAGLYVALANGRAGFQQATADIDDFGANADAGGWTSFNLVPGTLGDVNGDGKADLI